MRIFLTSLLLFVLCGCRSAPPEQRHAAKPAPPRQKQIFLVIDDAGLSVSEARPFLEIPVPMTIAVLPHLKQTREVCAVIAQYSDKEIILHQPMEAYDPTADTGPGAIYNTTHPSAVAKILDRNLASVRGAVGMNNHMGSRVTENPVLIAEILQYCRDRGLFFFDSKTAYNSVVQRVAYKRHFHYEGRDVFLDIHHDRKNVRKAWESTVAKARSQGYAIAIGHIWCAETAAAVRDSYETLLNQGYTFHKLSELYE